MNVTIELKNLIEYLNPETLQDLALAIFGQLDDDELISLYNILGIRLSEYADDEAENEQA